MISYKKAKNYHIVLLFRYKIFQTIIFLLYWQNCFFLLLFSIFSSLKLWLDKISSIEIFKKKLKLSNLEVLYYFRSLFLLIYLILYKKFF